MNPESIDILVNLEVTRSAKDWYDPSLESEIFQKIFTKPFDPVVLDQVSIVDGDGLAGLHQRDVADYSQESGAHFDFLVQSEHRRDLLVS